MTSGCENMLLNNCGKVVATLLLLAPLCAQELKVACEPKPETLRILEGLPLSRDYSVPVEARMGPLRALAEQNPDDFFIQRYYRDTLRLMWHLADEFDRALALYRKRPADPLSRYWEARLLMYAEPARSKKRSTNCLRLIRVLYGRISISSSGRTCLAAGTRKKLHRGSGSSSRSAQAPSRRMNTFV